MNPVTQWLEGLPGWIRHPLGIFIGTSLTVILGEVISKGTVQIPNWGEVVVRGLDLGVVAAIGSFVVLFVTPLTDAYGVGKTTYEDRELDQDPDDDDLDDDDVYFEDDDDDLEAALNAKTFEAAGQVPPDDNRTKDDLVTDIPPDDDDDLELFAGQMPVDERGDGEDRG